MAKHLIATAPDALLEAVKAAAEKDQRSQADFIREVVASAVGYTGPLTNGTRPVRKYANDEERKAAEKERRQLKNKLYKEFIATGQAPQPSGKASK